MRTSDVLLLIAALPVAACDRAVDPRVAAGALTEADDVKGRIPCRLGEARAFTPVCTAERADRVLTLRGPDGGFRRIRLSADGRGITTADGAEPARVRRTADGALEVAVADDRYRLLAR